MALPQLGEVVGGRYRVTRRIGDGGMAAVLEADDVATGGKVALKFLHDELRTHPVIPRRFVQEASAARALTTPHAVKMGEPGQYGDGTPYLVMELLTGDDLGKVARAAGRLDLERALSLVDQACEALEEAHARGIVHRDLKPENVFVVPTSHGELVKLLDFGISKLMTRDDGDKLTKTGMTVGTPHYMSPEQLRGVQDIDGRADVYATGVLLYEILAGRRPYDGGTFEEVILKIVTEPPPPLEQLRPDLPRSVVEVIARAMERDRDQRFPSMRALRVALAPFWSRRRLVPSGLPLPAPDEGSTAPMPLVNVASIPTNRSVPRARKRLGAGALAALVVGALVVVGGAVALALYALDGDEAVSPTPSAAPSRTAVPAVVKPVRRR